MDNYEEKYKKALSWMQGLYKGLHGKTKEEAEEVFPELAESEDDKIRKFLIQMAQNGHGGDKDWWNKCVAWLEKQGEQKPAWSEEDEKMINKLLAVVKLYYDRDCDDLDKQSCISFLKSLKDRVQSQPKKEWSEEDRITRNALINLVEMYYGGCINKSEKNRLLDWLKSLRPQSHWKPSDAQMKALKEACDEHWEPDGLDPLYTLYQDLKKLREE